MKKVQALYLWLTFDKEWELLNLGTSIKEGSAHQKQARIHQWHSHFIISIGVYTFSCSSLD